MSHAHLGRIVTRHTIRSRKSLETLRMPAKHVCPNCGTAGMESFFNVDGVPVHSVQLLKTRQEALDYPKGNIELDRKSVV